MVMQFNMLIVFLWGLSEFKRPWVMYRNLLLKKVQAISVRNLVEAIHKWCHSNLQDAVFIRPLTMPVYTAYLAVLTKSELFVYTSIFKGHLKSKFERLHLCSSFNEIKEKRQNTLEGWKTYICWKFLLAFINTWEQKYFKLLYLNKIQYWLNSNHLYYPVKYSCNSFEWSNWFQFSLSVLLIVAFSDISFQINFLDSQLVHWKCFNSCHFWSWSPLPETV